MHKRTEKTATSCLRMGLASCEQNVLVLVKVFLFVWSLQCFRALGKVNGHIKGLSRYLFHLEADSRNASDRFCVGSIIIFITNFSNRFVDDIRRLTSWLIDLTSHLDIFKCLYQKRPNCATIGYIVCYRTRVPTTRNYHALIRDIRRLNEVMGEKKNIYNLKKIKFNECTLTVTIFAPSFVLFYLFSPSYLCI